MDDGVEAVNGPAWCLRDASVCHFKPLQFSAASYNMHTFHNSWRATKTCSRLRRKTPLCVRGCHAFNERNAFFYGKMGLQAEVISHNALVRPMMNWELDYPYSRADGVIEGRSLA